MKINRRIFIAGTAAAAAATALGSRWLRPSQRKLAQPNILLFIADDMRYDATGYMGNSVIETPTLDQQAAQSGVFRNAFVTTSICPISRASIMSGEYALRHGVYNFDAHMRQNSFRHSFPVLLRQAGYHTGFIGKWGIGNHAPAIQFDMWKGYVGLSNYYRPGSSEHLTDRHTNYALQFLDNCPEDKPFLLIVSYKAPHGPLIPQPRFSRLYQGRNISRALTDTREAAQRLPTLLKESSGRKHYHNLIGNQEQYNDRMRKYYQLITGLDDSMGKIIDRLRDNGMRDTTCILHTSDNGLMLGEHRMVDKWCMYEESIRVPLLIQPSWSHFSLRPIQQITSTALNIDIAPTILSLAGVEVPANMQGRSLLPLLQNVTDGWQSGFYYEHPAMDGIPGCEGFRGQKWKYSRYYQGERSEECLFDLQNDARELNNLAGKSEHAAKLEEMRGAMKRRKEELEKA